MKMGKEILTFGDIEIENHKLYCYQSPIFLEDVDIGNMLVSNKSSSDEKNLNYIIGYCRDDYKIKPLFIILPKSNAYIKS